MIITNEPGYYKEGKYGIRIENILTIESAHAADYQKFRALTLIPYCRNLIEKSMLSKQQLSALEQYYTRINREVVPLLESKEY